ncbi:MAG: uncharacterized membrane protein (DUF373 family) [Cycloclasticus sp.]|jgi:uncharacterized membrane protein (DUF373 family)
MNKVDELPEEHPDALLSRLHKTIKLCIRTLAVLMVFVIFWGVLDVFYVIYTQISKAPYMLLAVSDIFKVFAAFLVVLIAIEIYQNIILYLRTDVIPIKLVIATALMAIARKVIIIDLKEVSAIHIFSIAAVVLALGVTYYLVGLQHKDSA